MTSQGPPQTHCHLNVCKLATTQRQDSGVCVCVCMCVCMLTDKDTNRKTETEIDPGKQEL